jgi:hypothetical protein
MLDVMLYKVVVLRGNARVTLRCWKKKEKASTMLNVFG